MRFAILQCVEMYSTALVSAPYVTETQKKEPSIKRVVTFEFKILRLTGGNMCASVAIGTYINKAISYFIKCKYSKYRFTCPPFHSTLSHFA